MDKTTRNFALAIVILICAAAAAVAVLCCFIPRLGVESRLFDTAGRPGPFIAAMYVGCAAALWFLAELLFVMLSVKRGEPFVKRNVTALKHMALCCLIAAAALFCMLFLYGWYRHFSIIVCIFILLFGVLCALTLSRVFDRAVEYKAENDLTI